MAFAVDLFLCLTSLAPAADTGYQGFGAKTRGGSGGTVVRVTNLNDSGEGSFRAAASQGKRTIIFTVGGEIVLRSDVQVNGAFVTIDGTTASPPGMTLRTHGLRIRGDQGAHDVIVRGIRVREAARDGIQVAAGAYNIVIDHVSVQGSGDGNIDITQKGTRDVTVSWSILAQPAGEEKNMLLAFKQSRVSLHHNIFVNAQQRNPQVTYDDSSSRAQDPDTTLDMRNNIIWNWRGGYGTRIRYGARANVVNNFYSSAGGDAKDALIICRGTSDSHCGNDSTNLARVYANGNHSADDIDLNRRGTGTKSFPAANVVTVDACTAARQVLAQAGAQPLDPVDQQQLSGISPACTGRFESGRK